MSDLVLSRRELQILTNCIYSGDTRYIQVSYPFFSLRLFTLDMKRPELTKIVRAGEFDTARLERKPTDRGVSADELPSYSDLRNCLLSSGFLNYKNEQDVAKVLLDLKDEARDPNKRPRPVFVAVDTNILYDKFLSRHLPLREEASGRTVEADDFRYALTEIVQMEIDSRITHKYSREEIGALGTLFDHKELLPEFRNASGRRGRIAKLAFNEMNYLLSDLRALRVKGTPTRGKERNDIEIAQSYKSFARGGDYDVLLLTADEDMVHHARTSELMAVQLELPFEVPEHGRMDPWGVTDLIYDLAVTFGAVTFDNLDMVVLGEWTGKSSADYSRENLKVRTRDDESYSKISQQLVICREILQRTNG